MDTNLIPQDRLTLDLLAEVLAKMYRHSLDNGGDVPDGAAGSIPATSHAGHEGTAPGLHSAGSNANN